MGQGGTKEKTLPGILFYMSEQKSVEKFAMLCDAHHLKFPEARDVMGRPQR